MQTPAITIGGEADWTLRQAELVESVCGLGFIQAEVLSKTPHVDAQAMLRTAASVHLPTDQPDHPWRYVNGIVWNWSFMGPFHEQDGMYLHRCVIMPPMVLLSLRRYSRAFNNMPIKQVWREIIHPWGDAVPFSDGGPMMVLDQEPCTVTLESARQSDETDLDFLIRILHTNGVFWFHDSPDPDSPPILRLGTMSRGARPWGSGESLTFNPDATAIAYGPNVLQWSIHAMSGPRTPVVHAMHQLADLHTPPANAGALSQPPSASMTGFDWFRMSLSAPKHGEGLVDLQSRIAGVLEQSMALDNQWATGIATTHVPCPGHSITINDLPGKAPSDWFVVSTRTLFAGKGLGTGSAVDEHSLLSSIRAVPLSTPFRPPVEEDRLTPPLLHGEQMDVCSQRPLRVGEA